MAGVKFRIDGLKECEAALEELKRATAAGIVRRALIDASQSVIDDAERMAPKLSGALEKSIGAGTQLTRRQKSLNRKQSDVEIYVGAGGLAQATQQEFGNAHNRAQPFLRPAWDQNVGRVLSSIRDALAKQIEKTQQRLAKKAARLAGNK